MQPASSRPLVLRQVPIWEDGAAKGFVDLALERAYVYRPQAPSEVVEIPKDMMVHEKEARFAMLERLADYDDELLEQLLNDMEPPRDRVFADLTRELGEGSITPVLFGSAENGNGILRLLKALRHEAPGIEATCKRLGLDAKSGSVAQIARLITRRMAASCRSPGCLPASCRTGRFCTVPAVRMRGLPASSS